MDGRTRFEIKLKRKIVSRQLELILIKQILGLGSVDNLYFFGGYPFIREVYCNGICFFNPFMSKRFLIDE